MNKQLTEIGIILDCSGSMNSIKDSMSEGLWSTILEQRNQPGECRVSLYRFNDTVSTVFEGKPAGDITLEDCRIHASGSTALHDAIVHGLNNAETRILAMAEDARPAFVVFVVITDGKNNASRENTKAQANEAIQRVTDKYRWQFLYLSADPDGFADGADFTKGCQGVSVGMYAASTEGAGEMHARYSHGISQYRRGLVDSVDISKPLTPGNTENE